MENKTETGRFSWFSRFWSQISEPHPAVKDAAQRRRARLTAHITLLLVIASILSIVTISLVSDNSKFEHISTLVFMLVGSLVGYAFSRTRSYHLGIAILMIAIVAFAFGRAGAVDADRLGIVLTTLPIVFVIGLALFELRGIIILTAAIVLTPLALPFIFPQFDWVVIGTTSGSSLVMGLMAIMVTFTREGIERDRLTESLKVNRELQTLSTTLESRVDDRTRDLSLASEVGRRIGLIRDLESLLSDTVNLIREHFDLYYAQIYLMDQFERNLVMKAGTGEVGTELVRRAHRLSVDLASINGTAAAERRTVIVADTAKSLIFRPHTLLPETRSEMAIPLISGDRVLGVLDLQSSKPGALTQENLPVFETLAGQLAIALLNVELFSQVERNLAELESRSRREVREGWGEYLDAIETKERFGYTFDRLNISPLEEKLVENEVSGVIAAPMQISGESVGVIQLESDHSWSFEDQQTARTVANMVAQQIENLRLFNQAERYQREVEEALQRQTHEEWNDFLNSEEAGELAFVYDGQQVQSANAGQNGHAAERGIDIKVQGESIGQFGFSDEMALLPEDEELLNSVTDQLGAHLENLRLYINSQRELVERRRTEEDLSQTLRVARMGYWEFDLATSIFTFNDQFYAMLHTTAEAEGGYQMSLEQYSAKFVHAGDLPAVGAEIGQAVATTDPNFTRQVEFRIFYADGGMGWINVMITVVKDAEGRTIKIRGANQDITERKNADLALDEQRELLQQELVQRRRTEEDLSQTLLSAHMGYWELDLATGLFTFTDQFYAMLRTTAEAEGGYQMPVDRYVEKFVHPEDAENVGGETAKAIAATDPNYSSQVEHRFFYADGEMGWVNVMITIVKDADGNTIKTRGANQDVSERRRAQEIITKRAAELAMVADVSTKVSTIQSPDEMLQTVVDLTKESFELYHAHVYLVNDAGDMLELTKGAGEVGREMVSEGRKIEMDAEKSLVARAARSRVGVIVNDVRLDPEFLPHPLLPETHSEMAVPMIAGDHLLGVIDVQDEEIGRFSQEDVSILTTLAAQVAVSLQNARSYERAQRQAEREALINSISERIQATNSVESALQVAVREIGRALGAQHTAIRLGLERKTGGQ